MQGWCTASPSPRRWLHSITNLLPSYTRCPCLHLRPSAGSEHQTGTHNPYLLFLPSWCARSATKPCLFVLRSDLIQLQVPIHVYVLCLETFFVLFLRKRLGLHVDDHVIYSVRPCLKFNLIRPSLFVAGIPGGTPSAGALLSCLAVDMVSIP